MLSAEWRCLGWIVAPAPWLFALRLAWEAVVLPIIQGPQMVGFSLLHRHPGLTAAVVGAAFLGLLWVVLTAGWVVYTLSQKRRVDRLCWVELVVLTIPLCLVATITAIDALRPS
jgi:hypothetical protein